MLRTILIFAACSLVLSVTSAQTKVGDNTLTIDSASILELESTSKGFLPSRLSTLQRDAQSAWDEGHIIYNVTDSCLQIYSGTSWDCFVKGILIDSTIYKYDGTLTSDRTINMDGKSITFNGSGDVVITDSGFVGIGDPTPEAKLDVEGGTVRLSDYGSGTNTGSESYLLGVDSDGDVIEVSPAIDTFLIKDDTLQISLKGDREAYKYVELGQYALDNQIIDSIALTGTNLELSLEDDGEALKVVDLSSINTDDQIIDSLALTGTTLEIGLEGDVNGLQSVDLTSIVENIYNTSDTLDGNRQVTLDGNTLTFDAAGSRDLLIEADGDIGVGTSSPNAELQIHGDNTESAILLNSPSIGSSATDGLYLGITDADANGWIWNYENADLSFGTNNLTKMTLKPTGQVQFLDYGSDTFLDNSPARLLAVQADGDIVETNMSLVGTDDQILDSLGLTGTTLEVGIEGDVNGLQTVDLSSINTDDQIIDSLALTGTTLEIGLENDANGLQTVDLSSIDTDTDNQVIDSIALTGTNLELSLEDDGEVLKSIDLSSINTDDQVIDSIALVGTNLELSLEADGEALKVVDLSSLQDGTGTDDQILDSLGLTGSTLEVGIEGDVNGLQSVDLSSINTDDQTIDSIALVGTNLELSLEADGEALKVVDLSSLQDGTGTDDQILDSLGLTGSTLEVGIEGDVNGLQSVDLSSINTDDQTIDSIALVGTNLELSLEADGEALKVVDLSSLQDGTGTDDQILDSLGLTGTTLEVGIEGDVNGLQSIDLSSIDTDTDDQVIDSIALVGTNLELSLQDDGEALKVVDLSSLQDGTGTDDQILDSLGLTGTTLEVGIEGDVNGLQSIDLSSIDTDTDDQVIDSIALTGTNLELSLQDDGEALKVVDLSSLQDGTGTDDQILDSLGLTGTTLEIGIEGDVNGLQTLDLSSILGSSENIYNTSDSLEADRVVTMDGNSLTFDGIKDLIIEADGDLGIGTTTPSGDLQAISSEDHDAFNFTQQTGTTIETDVFTIEDQDVGSGTQGESSVLKVVKSGNINAADNGFGLVELAYTGTDPGANKNWISGRKTDEGAPLWGVDITDNDFWSEGGIILGVTGADGGTYSGGNFIVEPDGDVGVGTTTPGARLEVDGGSVIFDEYGIGTYNDTSANYILATDTAGNVVELNTAANTRWFYAPAVTVDASDTISNATIDLHQEYIDQFVSIPAAQRSTGAPDNIPVYAEDELYYYVTFYDNSVIDNISISVAGVLTYDIISVPFDNYTIVNVVFLIK